MPKLFEGQLEKMVEMGRQELIAANTGQPLEVPAAEPPKQTFEEALQSQIEAAVSRGQESEGMSR